MNLWFTFTLKKIGGFKHISVGCRVTKNSSNQRTLLFYSSRNICIFLNLMGPWSSPDSSKPPIFILFMNLRFICYMLTGNFVIKFFFKCEKRIFLGFFLIHNFFLLMFPVLFSSKLCFISVYVSSLFMFHQYLCFITIGHS